MSRGSASRSPTGPRPLAALAALYGVQTSYRGADGRRRVAAPESLLAVLRCLGVPAQGFGDLPAAVRAARAAVWCRLSDPVAALWTGRPASVRLRLPAAALGRVACRIALEDGSLRTWLTELGELPAASPVVVDGQPHTERLLPLPPDLPPGYHDLTVEAPGRRHAAIRLIVAPRRAWRSPERRWGVFMPLYALRSAGSWGAGNVSDLAALADWTGARGGSLVGVLPLLAAFLDEPFDPSPYAPASRLFWNEFYLDLTAAGAAAGDPADLRDLRAAPLVDYRRGMAVRRRALADLARRCFAGGPELAALERWVQARPAVRDYARFRATLERRGAPWFEWPEPLRSGVLRDGDWDAEAERRHLYAQWLADRQLAQAAREPHASGAGLYLDLPLGVHPAGYDVWRHRAAFADGAVVGAPPDAFFASGQNWGFPPPHPLGLRADGYAYPSACLSHQMRYARALRLDHVMSLHRLFWIPAGADATAGVYVRYHAEELYAVLTLESHRHRCELVGEDLGVVPGYVRSAMRRHGLRRLHVVAGEAGTTPAVPEAPPGALAMLGTHDMPPFAAWWAGLAPAAAAAVVSQLRSEGWLRTVVGAVGDVPSAEVLQALLARLAAGRAAVVIVALEDLWGEARPQNVPGSGPEAPNWCRPARLTLEALSGCAPVEAALRRISGLRSPAGHAGPPTRQQ